MKLLIAEDEAIIRMDLKETLQDLGYEIIAEARSGREAVQKAFAFAPDCALMDAHMDGDDGFTAAQEIAQAQLCPVVMVTAYAQADKVKEASKMGVFGYVTKPFAEKDLVAAIEVATSRFKQEEQLHGELDRLKARMESRRLIDKAKCLLIEAGATEEEAFGRMRKISMNTRKPLAEVAEAIILGYEASH